MDYRLKTCIIIRRNNEYLVGMNWLSNELRWSIDPYDAWRTRKKDFAQEVARLVGGVMVLFNPILGEKRIL